MIRLNPKIKFLIRISLYFPKIIKKKLYKLLTIVVLNTCSTHVKINYWQSSNFLHSNGFLFQCMRSYSFHFGRFVAFNNENWSLLTVAYGMSIIARCTTNRTHIFSQSRTFQLAHMVTQNVTIANFGRLLIIFAESTLKKYFFLNLVLAKNIWTKFWVTYTTCLSLLSHFHCLPRQIFVRL